MTILKLPNVHDTHTGHIKSCEEVAGNFGSQIKFGFANDDILFLPADSAHRQLLHAGFKDAGGNPPKADLTTVAGNTLCFSRTPNKTPGAKPYWNIELASGGSAPAPSKRMTHADALKPNEGKPLPPDDRFRDVPLPSGPDGLDVAMERDLGVDFAKHTTAGKMESYFALARQVAEFQAELGRTHEMPWDGQSVNAMTFSIWNTR